MLSVNREGGISSWTNSSNIAKRSHGNQIIIYICALKGRFLVQGPVKMTQFFSEKSAVNVRTNMVFELNVINYTAHNPFMLCLTTLADSPVSSNRIHGHYHLLSLVSLPTNLAHSSYCQVPALLIQCTIILGLK